MTTIATMIDRFRRDEPLPRHEREGELEELPDFWWQNMSEEELAASAGSRGLGGSRSDHTAQRRSYRGDGGDAPGGSVRGSRRGSFLGRAAGHRSRTSGTRSR